MRVTMIVDDVKGWEGICEDIADGTVNRVVIRGTQFDKVLHCSECGHHRSTDIYDYCDLIHLPVNLEDFCSRGVRGGKDADPD